jgi:hypothetical protein
MRLLMTRCTLTDDETAALRKLLERRRRGVFISMEEGRKRIDKMLAQRRKALKSKKKK